MYKKPEKVKKSSVNSTNESFKSPEDEAANAIQIALSLLGCATCTGAINDIDSTMLMMSNVFRILPMSPLMSLAKFLFF